jgi:hypothetical protein
VLSPPDFGTSVQVCVSACPTLMGVKSPPELVEENWFWQPK